MVRRCAASAFGHGSSLGSLLAGRVRPGPGGRDRAESRDRRRRRPRRRCRRRPARPRRPRSSGRRRRRSRPSSSTRSARATRSTSIAKQFGTTAQSIAYWNRVDLPVARPRVGRLPAELPRVGWTLRLIPNSRGRPGEPAARPGDPGADPLRRRRRAVRTDGRLIAAAIVCRCHRPPRRAAHRRDRRRRRPGRATRTSRRARTALYAASMTPPGRRADRRSTPPPAPERLAERSRRWTACCSAAAPTSTRRATARPSRGSTAVEPARDALEAEAWAVAQERGAAGPRDLPRVPGDQRVLGRHASSSTSTATRARVRDRDRRRSTRSASRPARGSPGSSSRPTPAAACSGVNSYHHQAVRASDLAPGLVANAWASSPAGDLVEGLEAADGRFVVRRPVPPERPESTPAAFERLFSVFVDAARGPLDRR